MNAKIFKIICSFTLDILSIDHHVEMNAVESDMPQAKHDHRSDLNTKELCVQYTHGIVIVNGKKKSCSLKSFAIKLFANKQINKN